MMRKKTPFKKVLAMAGETLLIKFVSFKNIIAMISIALGVVIINLDGVGARFKDWADYMFKILVLFYASNQVQKYIFSRKSLNGYVHPGYDDQEEFPTVTPEEGPKDGEI